MFESGIPKIDLQLSICRRRHDQVTPWRRTINQLLFKVDRYIDSYLEGQLYGILIERPMIIQWATIIFMLYACPPTRSSARPPVRRLILAQLYLIKFGPLRLARVTRMLNRYLDEQLNGQLEG